LKPQKQTPESDPKQGRAYRPPELFVYGDVRELTQSNALIGGLIDGRMLGTRDYRT
jgi:hypothetical protein